MDTEGGGREEGDREWTLKGRWEGGRDKGH